MHSQEYTKGAGGKEKLTNDIIFYGLWQTEEERNDVKSFFRGVEAETWAKGKTQTSKTEQ